MTEESTSSPTPEPVPDPTPTAAPVELNALIPLPASVTVGEGSFTLASDAWIAVDAAAGDEGEAVGQYLSDLLSPATGYRLVVGSMPDPTVLADIALTLSDDTELGEEGYLLTITGRGVTLAANQPEGWFRGIQTLRQLFPPSIEQPTKQPGPWRLPAVTIRDVPRYGWRGAMLDVARHFFSVEDVKRYIDLMAAYKLNVLHLHLTDDQGWRLMIESWPELAQVGGSTAVDGDPGGFYTQADYAEIVAYAQSRYITIVPEIDLPGHTNAALAAYPELNCDGEASPLYTGIEVGFSSLCIDKELTYNFLDDVIGEVAALTPGPYIHIGGDEAHSTDPADYVQFIERVQGIVEAHGKQMVGWEEIARTDLLPTSIAQVWNTAPEAAARAAEMLAARPDTRVILSPGSRAYLDMKYNADSPLGLQWAGLVDVQTAYDWDPVGMVDGLLESRIIGVEAPLWSETLRTIDDIEYMAFPRLPGIAEIGWSPAAGALAGRSWDEYRQRLGAHGPRLAAMDVNFYRSPLVPWVDEP